MTDPKDIDAVLERACYRMEKLARSGAKSPGPKAEMEFHTPPELISPSHLAVLMATLTYAYTVSQALAHESPPKYPIHVHITIDGVTACGAVQPVGHGEPPSCSGDPS